MNTQIDHRRNWKTRLMVLCSFLLLDFFVIFMVFTRMALDTSGSIPEGVIMGLALLSVIGTFLLAFLPSFMAIAVALLPLLTLLIIIVYEDSL